MTATATRPKKTSKPARRGRVPTNVQKSKPAKEVMPQEKWEKASKHYNNVAREPTTQEMTSAELRHVAAYVKAERQDHPMARHHRRLIQRLLTTIRKLS